MSPLGLLASLGLAVVSIDVLGGVIAAALLGRGTRPAHLLLFIGSYAAAVVLATLMIRPLLTLAGGLLAPVLGSALWLTVSQLAAGTAFLGFALALIGSVVLVDGIVALTVGTHPWLQDLLLLRSELHR